LITICGSRLRPLDRKTMTPDGGGGMLGMGR
jgi:hypothetical protein